MHVYLLDMLNIPDEVRSAFESGKFAVKQKVGGFNGVWSDMATEKTIIRVSKQPWINELAAFAHRPIEPRSDSSTSFEACKLVAILISDFGHSSMLKGSVIWFWIYSIRSITCCSSRFIAVGLDSSCSSSASKQTPDLHLISDAYLDHGCFKENETRDFYSPISRSQLKTFEDLTKRCNLKCRSGEVIKAHVYLWQGFNASS
jgi:hypothetical protein